MICQNINLINVFTGYRSRHKQVYPHSVKSHLNVSVTSFVTEKRSFIVSETADPFARKSGKVSLFVQFKSYELYDFV